MAIYIDPSALVDGVGTEVSPYNSIYNVTTVANETYRFKRGTVQILAATYAPGSRVSLPTTPLTFEDYGDPSLPKPKLHRISSNTFNISPNTANILFRNISFSGGLEAKSLLYVQPGVTGLTISDCDFHAEATDINTSCISYLNNATTAYDGHTIKRCIFTAGVTAIQLLISSTTPVVHKNFLIESCSFTNVGQAIRFTVELAAVSGCGFMNFTLNNCTFTHIRNLAANFRGGYVPDIGVGPMAIQSYNLVMSNNYFYDCGITDSAACLNYSHWSNVDIYNNTIKYCASKGGLIHAVHTQYVYIHDNICEDARASNIIDGSGIFPDQWSDTVYIFRNKILNNKGTPGVQNSGEGIAVWKCSNIFIFSNIIYNCVRGFNVGGSPNKSSENIFLVNNTFINIPITSVSFDRDGVGLSNTAVTLANNLFINSPVGIDPGSSPQLNCSKNYFVNVTAPYLDAQLPGSGDMQFASLADIKFNPDYSPTLESPLVYAGEFLGYRRDFNGNQFHNPPSIGALEYEQPRSPRA